MEESPKKLLIGLVVGTMVVLSVMLMLNEMVDKNPTVLGTEYDSFKEKMDQSDNLNQSVSGLESLVKGSASGPLGVISAIVNTLWNGIKTIFSSVGFLGTMLESLSELLHIPSWVGTSLFMIVTLLLVFWLIDIIFRSA
jgi:hypothetical protein